MARQVNTTVHLFDAEAGEEVVFGPGDVLPGWAEKKLAESWPEGREDLWQEAEEKKSSAPAKKAEAAK